MIGTRNVEMGLGEEDGIDIVLYYIRNAIYTPPENTPLFNSKFIHNRWEQQCTEIYSQ